MRCCNDTSTTKNTSPALIRALASPPSLWSAGGGGPLFTLYWAVLILVFSLAAPANAQSGWTRARATYFVKVGYSFFTSSEYYNLDGVKVETAEFRQKSFDLYGEYGLTDRITLICHFPILKTNGFETTETVAGIGDLKTEIKYALLKPHGIPLTLSVAPEFPTGSRDNFAQSTVNDFDQINLPTGDGEFNVWTTLAGSASFYPVNAYLSGHIGYNLRTQYQGYSFQDQLKFGIEGGYKVGNAVWVNVMLQAQQSLGEQAGMTDFVRGDGTAYTAFSCGVSYEFISRWSASLQFWNYSDLLISRQNIYSDPTWSFGIFYEIK